MDRRDTYRQKAQECVAAAAQAANLEERIALLEIAAAWAKLAEHAPESANLDGQAPGGAGGGQAAPDKDTKH